MDNPSCTLIKITADDDDCSPPGCQENDPHKFLKVTL